METPHNARGPLAGEFQPLAVCKNLDYPPGKSRNLQDAAGGKGTAKRAAVLCGSSLAVVSDILAHRLKPATCKQGK